MESLIRFNISPNSRKQARYDLPAMPAVEAKVSVGGQNHRVGQRLAHTHQASIGKAQRDACLLRHRSENIVALTLQVKDWSKYSTSQHSDQVRRPTVTNQIEGFT